MKIDGKKIKDWFADRENLMLVGILLIALIIRIYYFVLTKSQPLWWDEAEYALRAKAFAFGTPLTGWATEREIVVPLIFAFLLKIGTGEIGLRVLQTIVSFATVLMTYVTIAKFSTKKIGLVAAFGMSLFWLHLFFSERVLVYLWAPLLYLIIMYYFKTGYIDGNRRHLIYFAVASAIGVAIYFSVGFLLFGLFIYMLMTEKMGLIKSKKAWMVLGIFLLFLIPHMIYFQITDGNPFPRYSVGLKATVSEKGAGLSGIFEYVKMFPSRVGWVFTILSFFGMAYFLFNFVLGIGAKDNVKNNSNWLALFIAFIVPFFLYTIYGVIGGSGTFYDAFILPVFPFAFAFAGLSIEKIYKFTKAYGKQLAIVVVLALLIGHAYFGITNAKLSIMNKVTSYDSLQFSGEWIKEHSNVSDTVISSGLPQNTYYSERATYPYPNNESDFETLLMEKKPAYMIISVWQQSPEWVYGWAQNHSNRVEIAQMYFFDSTKKQPTAIIYRFK